MLCLITIDNYTYLWDYTQTKYDIPINLESVNMTFLNKLSLLENYFQISITIN